MLASNEDMMDLLEALGPVRVVDREAGTVEVEAPLPDGELSPGLRNLLKLSAETDTAVPLASRPLGAPPRSPA
jgi:hypothetical protein